MALEAADAELQLDDPIERLEGIGPKRAALLANLGIRTVRGLLFHFPRAYQDRRRVTPIAEAQEGMVVTIEGEVVSSRNVGFRGRRSMAIVKVCDATGEMNATFYGRGFLAKSTFKRGVRAFFTGVVGVYKGLALTNPEYEVLSGDAEDLLHTGRVVPVYRLTEKVSQRDLRRWVHAVLPLASSLVEDVLPPALAEARAFPPVQEAMPRVHFPREIAEAEKARERFAYAELLTLQLAILGERAARLREEKGWRHTVDGPCLNALRTSLPFTLTGAQDRVVSEILGDMASPRPMVRLLQGDVGCGKTVVALHAIAAAADGGYQTALMAPTEILAEQHMLQLSGLLEPLGLSVALLTGSMRGAGAVRKRIEAGNVQVVVGTHTLIQEKTAFHNLGLVIVDEQHRFGIRQRDTLAKKGLHPDLLHMTATPIPRTLAITLYGGMDVSVIDELPPGRLPVKTRRVAPSKAPDLYRYIREQAEVGLQTYIVCPLINESEKREDLTPVLRHFEELSTGPLEGLRMALLHGRLDVAEKDAIMRLFKAGQIDALVSTTVIEVGIDVPGATTMVIEDAGQFGLTQLHQLRGRVGRGTVQSFCFFVGKPRTKEGERRLDVLCAHDSGFDIAEEDLLLRGPGEFYGLRQTGLADLRVADLLRDVRLLDGARRDAQAILERDPALEAPEHQSLARAANALGWLAA